MATTRSHEPVRVGAFLVRGLVVATAAFLLTSLGGAAIYIVAGLTMFEVAWAAAGNVTDHALLSVTVGAFAGFGLGLAFGHARPYRGVD